MAARQYQAKVYKLLSDIFDRDRVQSEWNIRVKASDRFIEPTTYAPRVDIAVGPFNPTSDLVRHDVGKIYEASSHGLIQDLISTSRSQNGNFMGHQNPRCLLAIEIEFSGSSKHILGDIANAGMMGLVGVVIGPPTNIKKIQRVCQYVQLLRSAKKGPPDLFTNVACFETAGFVKLLEKYRPQK